MTQNPDAGNDAVGVHADQGHHRLARVGGDVHDVGGQEYVTDQFTVVFAVVGAAFLFTLAVFPVVVVVIALAVLLGTAFLFAVAALFPGPVGLDISRLAHSMGKTVGARKHVLAWEVRAKIGVGGQLRG
ncbi:MAG: type IV secretion system protein [Thiobacillus sp.]